MITISIRQAGPGMQQSHHGPPNPHQGPPPNPHIGHPGPRGAPPPFYNQGQMHATSLGTGSVTKYPALFVEFALRAETFCHNDPLFARLIPPFLDHIWA